MQPIIWQPQVERALTEVRGQLSEAHRGAFLWHEPTGAILVFENRLNEVVPDRQLQIMHDICKRQRATIHAGERDAEGGSWAMLISNWDVDSAFNSVWAAWHIASVETDPKNFRPFSIEQFLSGVAIPFNLPGNAQYQIAKKTIDAYFTNPNKWKHCKPNFFV
jgi:hypothetical protein